MLLTERTMTSSGVTVRRAGEDEDGEDPWVDSNTHSTTE